MLFYELVYKPTFRNQLLALPPEAIPLIEDKTRLLTIDPEPKAKNKKRLKGTKGNIYRIRAGDYRIVYTYGSGRVSLLGVDHRKSVYSDDWDDDEPEPDGSTAKPEEPGTVRPVRRTSARDTRVPDYFTSDDLVSANDNNLPRDLDQEFLTRIQVPETHHRSLMRCRTLDDLIAVEIPAHIRERIFDTLVTPNYDHVLTQADYTVDSVEDFRRMLEGELVPMLLRLDPEQERHVNWPLAGTGPVLLKGAPGTGKSVVAVYRVRSLINALRGSGLQEPRILFASYTNALVNSARHLLNGLLGADAALVDIFTVDTVVSHLYAANGCSYAPIPDDGLRRAHIHKALKQMSCGDDSNQSLAQSIAKLSADYLFEEIDQVIVGRDLEEEDDYLTGPRPGRRVPLTEQQRRAVWRLYELVEQHTGLSQPQSYAQTRRQALRGVRDGWHAERYDGVVIDEAQDLSPTSIRLLFALAKSPDRLFLTADSNQCIYGNSFRWKDVHGDLQFRGRTSILRRNFRSTRQIVEAAAGFLTGAALDDEETDAVEHMRSGPKPVALRLENRDQEVTELVTYLRETTRALRVGLTSCAVLVGTEQVGQDIAGRLRGAGLPVEFMKGKQVDLERPVLTVTTFQSAKGLEFPIVAVAGLDKAPQFLAIEDSPQAEEQHMIHRRVLYVAMTRAMYALAVFLPWTAPEIHINCFTSESWLNERPASWTAWLDEVTALEPTSVSESRAA